MHACIHTYKIIGRGVKDFSKEDEPKKGDKHPLQTMLGMSAINKRKSARVV